MAATTTTGEREISNAFSPAATFDWICNVFRSILLCCCCRCLVLHDQSEFASFSWSLRLQCLSKFDCQLIVYSSFLIFTLRFSFSSFSPLFPTFSMSLFLSVAWAVNILIKMSRAMRRSLTLFFSLPLPLPSPPCTSRLSYQLCALSLISSLPDKATRSGPIVCQQRRHFVFVLLSFLCFLVLDAGLLPFIVCVPPAILLASCDNPPNQVIYIRHANTCTFMYMHAHTQHYILAYTLYYVC